MINTFMGSIPFDPFYPFILFHRLLHVFCSEAVSLFFLFLMSPSCITDIFHCWLSLILLLILHHFARSLYISSSSSPFCLFLLVIFRLNLPKSYHQMLVTCTPSNTNTRFRSKHKTSELLLWVHIFSVNI